VPVGGNPLHRAEGEVSVVALAHNPYALLIADDDEVCLDSLREVFEPEGYRTYLARSGPRAVEVVRRHAVHVALVDMQMPGMTGLETIRLLRDAFQPPIPCVLMSGEATQELRRKALAVHACSFIPKPLNLHVLRETVAEILQRYYHAYG